MPRRPWRVEHLENGKWKIIGTFGSEDAAETQRTWLIGTGWAAPDNLRVEKHVEFEAQR